MHTVQIVNGIGLWAPLTALPQGHPGLTRTKIQRRLGTRIGRRNGAAPDPDRKQKDQVVEKEKGTEAKVPEGKELGRGKHGKSHKSSEQVSPFANESQPIPPWPTPETSATSSTQAPVPPALQSAVAFNSELASAVRKYFTHLTQG